MSPRLLRPRASGLVATDPDARTYISAVQVADASSLEPAVQRAIDDFVKGCKADNIWTAIKASCILAGARTLAGALVPLKGAAPTNNGPFVSGDYDRKTGVIGNASTKYLDTNRAHNDDAQDNHHISAYISTVSGAINTGSYIGAGPDGAGRTTGIYRNVSTNNLDVRSRGQANNGGSATATGLAAISRSASGSFTARSGGSSSTLSVASFSGAGSETYLVFARNTSPIGLYSDGRIAFYSIGESLDLALLDTRVSNLLTAIGAAIP